MDLDHYANRIFLIQANYKARRLNFIQMVDAVKDVGLDANEDSELSQLEIKLLRAVGQFAYYDKDY